MQNKIVVLLICVFAILTASIVSSVYLLQNYYRIPTEGVIVTPSNGDYTMGRLFTRFAYSRPSPKSGVNIQFNDASYDFDGAIVEWLWDFGDGSESTEKNPVHAYATEGVYTVTLTVTDDKGRQNSIQATVWVVTPDYTIRRTTVYEAVNTAGQVVFTDPADATKVIQYAVDTLGPTATPSSPKTIFIEDGKYNLMENSEKQTNGENSAVWLWYYSYLNIEGASWNAILKTNNGAYNAIYFQGGFHDYPKNIGCRIANLQIDGGAPDRTQGGVWYQKNGIMTRMTEQTIFENLYIHHFGRTGMYNTCWASYNIIRNCLFEFNNRFGCSYTSSHSGHVYGNIARENKGGMNWDAYGGIADNTTIENNFFEDNFEFDFASFGGAENNIPIKNGVFQNNIILSTAIYGPIKIDFATENVVIRGNTIICSSPTSGEEGIFVTSNGPTWSSGITIEDNDIITTGPSQHGVTFWGASSCIVRNNRFNTTNYGVNVESKADTISIIGNTFAATNGVRIADSTCLNTLIEDNDFREVTGTIILDNGVGTIIKNNIYP